MDIQTGKTTLAEAEAFLRQAPSMRIEMDETLAELYRVCPGTAAIYQLEAADGNPLEFTMYADQDGIVQYIKLAIK